jgi:cytochrome c peroxidase
LFKENKIPISVIIALMSFFCLVNCTSLSKINKPNLNQQLGHVLFFDTDLSINQSKSCATCHDPKQYFTDGYKKAIGTYADVQMRNRHSIINSAQYKTLNWASPHIRSFEQQMQDPLFNLQHLEMGMTANNQQAETILNKAVYKNLLNNKPKNWQTITDAIASYCKSVQSNNTKWDLYNQTKDSNVFTEEEWRGKQLFFSAQLQCGACHGGTNFNEPIADNNYFINSGTELFFTDNIVDSGLAFSGNKNNFAKFRIPSLRNIAKTAPYFHHGMAADLNTVIDYYAQIKNNPDPRLQGFSITKTEKRALILFLNTLTDTTIEKKWWSKNPFNLNQN